jgi:hypothetical protein
LLADANLKKQPASFSFDELNLLMKNMGSEQFSYEAFKQVYDADPRVKPLVKNFDQEGITLATDVDSEEETQQQDTSGGAVSQMAKRATKARQ